MDGDTYAALGVRRRRRRRRGQEKKVAKQDWPRQWPNGSAMVRGPKSKGYRKHNHRPGMKEEDNPNLLGRAVRMPDGSMEVWRWLRKEKRYVRAGQVKTVSEAFDILHGRKGG